MTKELLTKSTDYLEQMYYHFMTNDNRLPELFGMIEATKLRKWIVTKLVLDLSHRELREYLENY